MPLGQYGYEADVIETPEPEREKRFDIVKVGVCVLGVALVGILLPTILQMLASHPDPYTDTERKQIATWFGNKADSPWLNPVKANLVGRRVVFDGANNETRIYRIRGLSYANCFDKVKESSQQAGLSLSNHPSNPLTPALGNFQDGLQSTDGKRSVDIELATNGVDVLICEVSGDDKQDLQELGRDFRLTPARDFSKVDWRDLAP